MSQTIEPVARAHVHLNDDGLSADLEVLDGTHLQVEHSPVDLYLLPVVTRDGPHKPNPHRVWLAKQLLDSTLTDEEAYSIVRYSPAIKPEVSK